MLVVPMLSVVPCAVFVFVLHRAFMTWPIYMNYFDPAYVFLFSGLSFANLATPLHVDHPGTPTQLLIAGCLRLYQLGFLLAGAERTSLYEIVADDPEAALFFVGLCTTGLYVALLGIMGYFAWKWTGSLWAAFLIQLSVFLYGEHLIFVAVQIGETSGMLFGLALSSLLLREWSLGRRGALTEDWKGPIIIGFCMAGIVFAKVTFAPLTLLILAVVPRRRALLTVAAFLASSFLFALAIASRLPHMLSWFWLLGTHQGKYGGGDAGFIDFAQVPRRFGTLLEAYPGGFVMMGLALIALLVIITRPGTSLVERFQDQRIRFLLCLLAAMAVQLALVLKHFELHYFIPNLTLSTMLACFIVFEATSPRARSRAGRTFARGGIIAYLVLVAHLAWAQVTYERALADQKLWRERLMEDIAAFRAAHANAIWIGTYPVPGPDAAIAFGMSYSQPRVATAFEQAAGRPIIYYHRWANRFQTATRFEEAAYISDLVKSGQEIILHLPRDYDYHTEFISRDMKGIAGLTITPLAEFGDGSTAYRVEPAS
jgi:hypothetical protein